MKIISDDALKAYIWLETIILWFVMEEMEILKLLMGNRQEAFSIRKISLTRKINYKSAYNAVKRLEKQGIITLKKTGNTTICSFGGKFNKKVFQAEYERREKLLKNRNFKVLHEKLDSLKFPFIALLFGSYARGTATKGSDIDILAICEKGREKNIERIISLLPLKIHLTTIDCEEFLSMAKSRQFTVVSESMKNNIILVGIEDYWRLVENAGQ